MSNLFYLLLLHLITIEFIEYKPCIYRISNNYNIIYFYELNNKIANYLDKVEEENIKNKYLNLSGEIAFCIENDFAKDIGDTITKTDIYGDIETFFSLNYKNKDFYYNFKTSYMYELYYKLLNDITTQSDEFKITNSLGFNSNFAPSLSIELNTPIFNQFEDSVLMLSFLSPAQIIYSLNLDLSKMLHNKTLIELKLGITSIKSTLVVNKDIDNVEDRFGILDNKYFSNSIGAKFYYLISKEWENSLAITNTGDIYFPSEEKPFSKEWFKTLTISLENDFTIFNKNGFKISFISNFKYNKFELKTFEMHHKLYCSITIK